MTATWCMSKALSCCVGGVLQITYRVGRTMFETAGLPEHLVKHCNAMDEVWVPTEFNKDTFVSAGTHPRCF